MKRVRLDELRVGDILRIEYEMGPVDDRTDNVLTYVFRIDTDDGLRNYRFIDFHSFELFYSTLN